MRRYLACFDISNDRVRLKAGKLLLEFGDRVQESVFEIFVERETDRLEIVGRLQALADAHLDPHGEDDVFNIRFYHLCKNCRESSFSVQGEAIATAPAAVIL